MFHVAAATIRVTDVTKRIIMNTEDLPGNLLSVAAVTDQVTYDMFNVANDMIHVTRNSIDAARNMLPVDAVWPEDYRRTFVNPRGIALTSAFSRSMPWRLSRTACRMMRIICSK
jgi:hypothetical protein